MLLLSIFIVLILFYFSQRMNKISEGFTNINKKKNCFIVISKEVVEKMYNSYSEIIKDDLIFISDNKSSLTHENIINYDSKLMKEKGFTNMHSKINVTSWDKVFYHLQTNELLKKYDYIWIIEDDCYINKNLFDNFIENYNQNNEDLIIFGWYKKNTDKWPLWSLNKTKQKNITFFKPDNLRASINQICRMSSKLIEETLKLREKHNTFCVHELLLASIVQENNLRILNDKRDDVKISPFKREYSKKSNRELKENNLVIVHPKKLWYDE
jgi:hypothetical protein